MARRQWPDKDPACTPAPSCLNCYLNSNSCCLSPNTYVRKFFPNTKQCKILIPVTRQVLLSPGCTVTQRNMIGIMELIQIHSHKAPKKNTHPSTFVKIKLTPA